MPSYLEPFGLSEGLDRGPINPGDVFFVELLGGDGATNAIHAFDEIPPRATLRSVEAIPGVGVWMWYVA